MHHNNIGRRAKAGSIPRLAVTGIAVSAVLLGCTSGRDSSSSTSSAGTTAGAEVSNVNSSTSLGASEVSSDPTQSAAPNTTDPEPATTVEATTTTAAPTTTSSTTTTTTEPPTTTTTIVTQGAIVIVANATKVPGGAAKLTDVMTRFGFQMGAPTDAAGNEEFRDTTQVYCLPGSEAVAGSIAILLGGIPVNYMPTPAPITDATVGLGDASVLVMLGKDLAGKNPPGLTQG